MALTLAELLRKARHQLTEAGIADAALDARLLVEHFSATTRTDAIADPDRLVDDGVVKVVGAALVRRISGEPVHRILGFREFYGLRLSLSKETLEPRPDTETLVEAVLPFVRRAVQGKGACSILDLGTGTGAIALALLSAAPQAVATGVDISADALATAARNAADLGLDGRFRTLQSDWFEKISGRYDAIVSNPPYIAGKEIAALQKEVRDFDPRQALDGGADGLDVYRIIAANAAAHLEKDGIVAVEIGSTQKEDVTALFERTGFIVLEAMRDLAGNDRVLVFSPV
ncbi:peptide chain release factor N(5)-glutamine methyltransferase [Mesorhizobium sp. 8]|uniref:peptide chain release factor N(5)-glutamine methyltransferase n=1 Tax=Mesorhizobium sp. 8 TaxID=2584466 RepID=UPI00111F6930|nr:peptide chain release factor N(5)-glutamine methyltransferase [Mesorhizobium sp. 8]QDC01012.1 peptide chain release factor N(5)-glutamine methyltransferase [Mesorhizobium sp. 8]